MPKGQNKVWIELEKPRNIGHASVICLKANRMLQRLNGDKPITHDFAWDVDRQRFSYGNTMGRMVLTNNGCWFDLDHLGRE